MVADEVWLVVQRENQRIASEAIAMRAAAGAVMEPKEGGKHFNELIKRLMGE